MPAVAFLHEEDPRDVLARKIGDVESVEVFHNQVLVAIYIAPGQMASGLFRTDVNRDEDRYQSKVGLVLKCGPRAFESTNGWTWPEDIKPGDWIYFRVSDGWPLTVNSNRENLCRILDDTDVRGRVRHPDQVW